MADRVVSRETRQGHLWCSSSLSTSRTRAAHGGLTCSQQTAGSSGATSAPTEHGDMSLEIRTGAEAHPTTVGCRSSVRNEGRRTSRHGSGSHRLLGELIPHGAGSLSSAHRQWPPRPLIGASRSPLRCSESAWAARAGSNRRGRGHHRAAAFRAVRRERGGWRCLGPCAMAAPFHVKRGGKPDERSTRGTGL
jgi:hypothetical protein